MAGRPKTRLRETEQLREVIERTACFIASTTPDRVLALGPSAQINARRDPVGFVRHHLLEHVMRMRFLCDTLVEHYCDEARLPRRPSWRVENSPLPPPSLIEDDQGRLFPAIRERMGIPPLEGLQNCQRDSTVGQDDQDDSEDAADADPHGPENGRPHDQDAATDARGGHADSVGDTIAAPDAPEVVPDRDRASESPGTRLAQGQQWLVDLIRSAGGSVTTRYIMRRCRAFRTSADADTALNALVQAGLGEWIEMPSGPTGGKPSRRFMLVDNTPPVSADNTPAETPVVTSGADTTPADEA